MMRKMKKKYKAESDYLRNCHRSLRRCSMSNSHRQYLQFDARIDGSIVYLRDFGSIVKPRGRNSR